jgi:hypothetical protein
MTHPTDAAIAQAFRERLESMYSPLTVREVMKAVEDRARELDAEKGGEAECGPGSNTGHGHVWKRPDGVTARCGGPVLCLSCRADAKHYAATPPAQAAEAVSKLVATEVEVSQWPNVREGMHVGLATGVKVTHTPTGTTVICTVERSQHRNRERALRGLAAAIAAVREGDQS